MLAPFVIAGIATPYSAFSANGPGRRSAVGASLQRDVVASVRLQEMDWTGCRGVQQLPPAPQTYAGRVCLRFGVLH